MENTVCTEQHSRRYSRSPLVGKVRYQYGSGEFGMGEWRDVCRAGAGLRLGRYLRPGRRLLITFEAEGVSAEVKAQVVWCRPRSGEATFEAGIRIYHDVVEAEGVLWSLTRLEDASTAEVPDARRPVIPAVGTVPFGTGYAARRASGHFATQAMCMSLAK